MRYHLRDFLLIPFISIAFVAIWWFSTNGTDFEALWKLMSSSPENTPITASSHSHPKIAISTTIKRPTATLQTWLNYSLRRFDLIIMFMDDPKERPAFERFIGDRPVVLLNGSTEWNHFTIPSRIMLRQHDNNEAALSYALAHNITWLMHLDSDELFYEDGEWDWDALENVGLVHFANLEALPLSRRTANFFMESRLFKTINSSLEFLAYGNGKSAVRVTPGVRPLGPHSWDGFEGESLEVNQPIILHYPYPSFDSWFGKFKSLGRFSDFWFDDPENPNEMKFMLKSRDVVLAAMASGDTTAAREFFGVQVPDGETRDRLIAEGSLREVFPFAARKP